MTEVAVRLMANHVQELAALARRVESAAARERIEERLAAAREDLRKIQEGR